jgi:methylated-DNA-[protein]-cysteine S-methyltransferase
MPSLSLASPVGRLRLDEEDGSLAAIRWDDSLAAGNGSPLLIEAARQLEAYFDRRLTHFDLPLTPVGSPFDQRVWQAMRQIPHGQTRTYGELAMEVGSAPRAVGGACGRNPIPIVIPCHRILARNGFGGYSGGAGLPTKRCLLDLERAGPGGLSSQFGADRRKSASLAAHLT